MADLDSRLFLAGPRQALRWLAISLGDDQVSRLPTVRQPMVAVAGERDPVCPVPWVEAFARAMPRGRCEVIPGAPHAMNSSAPAALARIVADVVDNGSEPRVGGWGGRGQSPAGGFVAGGRLLPSDDHDMR